MKFSTAAFIAIGFLAGNVVAAPAVQSNDVALPIEARARGSVANDAAVIDARAERRANGAGKGKSGVNANILAARAANDKNKNNKNKNNNKAAAAAAAKKKKNNNNNNAAAAKAEAKFNGLACTNGKGAGTCNNGGQCTVNGKTAQIAGQCGVAAAAAAGAKKAN
ncbi:hypothetical protein LX32DRAFT_669700 [Colletotrichum zoysiae]|uniref:Uncharacterized protein n=1 Tax=Colletotrichum zoysiae TaxID=1216348 RepID=A0AAD9HV13_9PEZI|nr:hypothetical protein LX32DRAFT_669700 [Colletotrichum zoysiae]